MIIIMNKHFVALGGLRGYLPNFCEVFKHKGDAIEYVANIHDLSVSTIYSRSLTVNGESYVDLNLKKHGNEYAEIITCCCDTPFIHSDSCVSEESFYEDNPEFEIKHGNVNEL